MAFFPTLEETISVMENKNYRIYTNEEGFDLNIVGIRTTELKANSFNDFITMFYRMHGEWIFNIYRCTTDPGAYYLENPLSELGTAILKKGQYKGCYRIGRHKGKYTALVQNAPVTVIRDPNRDNVLDVDTSIEETGYFGINIHRASQNEQSIQVNQWSAGCQVFSDPFQYDMFINVCKKGREIFGNSFTYTLLSERDFENI